MRRSITLIVLVLMVLMSCGSKNDGQVKIEYVFYGDNKSYEAAKSIAQSFMKDNKDIRIILTHVPDQAYIQKILTRFGAGNPPDVMLLQDTDFHALVKNDLFLPCDSFMQENSINDEDYFIDIFNIYMYEDRQYGIPHAFNTLVMYYNKKLFDEASLDYPGKDYSLNRFKSDTKRLTRGTNPNDRIYGTMFMRNGVGYLAELMMWSRIHGGQVFDDEGKKIQLLSSPVMEATRMFRDMMLKEKVSPKSPHGGADKSQDAFSLFLSGRLATLFTGRWAIRTFREIKDFEWDVAPVPYYRNKGSMIFSDGWVVSRHTKNPEACFRFIKFLIEEKGQVLAARLSDIPIKRSVTSSKYFTDPAVSPASDHYFLDCIPDGSLRNFHPRIHLVIQHLSEAMDRYFLELEELDSLFSKAEKDINKILAEEK